LFCYQVSAAWIWINVSALPTVWYLLLVKWIFVSITCAIYLCCQQRMWHCSQSIALCCSMGWKL